MWKLRIFANSSHGEWKNKMNVKIIPNILSGTIRAVSSKSDAHRALICASLSDSKTSLIIDNMSRDIEATISCIEQMGGKVIKSGNLFTVTPISYDVVSPTLDCGESGSTLRFLFPLANLVCKNPTFTGRGRLPHRPLSPLREEMEKNGCQIIGDYLPITTEGRLKGGVYTLAGNVSSQFISGLLFALPLCEKDSKIVLSTPLESKGYVNMTLKSLRDFGIEITEKENEYIIKGGQKYISPEKIIVEGDWSNAAFWLCSGALGGKITCKNLNFASNQGDKEIVSVLERFGADVLKTNESIIVSKNKLSEITLDCTHIPDLVPIISAVASVSEGTTILTGVERLKIKESDRLSAICETLKTLGADVHTDGKSLTICGKDSLKGGSVKGYNDHRMVMMAAILATRCTSDVTISDAEAVEKSYPDFFNDYKTLGGVFDVI